MGGRRWTAEEDQYLRENYATTRNCEIAAVLRRSQSAVDNRGQHLGLITPPGLTRIGLKASDQRKARVRETMQRLGATGKLKPPTEAVYKAGLAACATPASRDKRKNRAAETMRGRPQRLSGLTAAAPHNVHAKTYTCLSPDRVKYTFTNLNHFVRENHSLFASSDVIWKGTKNKWCRASRGLGSLFRDTGRARLTWKGWVAVKKHNAGLSCRPNEGVSE